MERVPAYEGDSPFLFVSYAHKDSMDVLSVVNALFERKYRVWYDEGIAPGSEWPKNIADHLNRAEGCIIFVSDHSLRSPNCENEVVRSVGDGKEIIEFSLHGAHHTKLEEAASGHVSTEKELLSVLPERYIGDGTGYESVIGTARTTALWNILIGLAAVLVIGIGIGLFGLNKGWFDAYLPGLQTAQTISAPDSEKNTALQSVTLTDELLSGAVAAAAGKENLNELLVFPDESVKKAFYRALEMNPKEKELRYLDLTLSKADQLAFSDCSDETMEYLTYFPELREVTLDGGHVTSLEFLQECPRLERVYISSALFPLTIPEKASFTVVLK